MNLKESVALVTGANRGPDAHLVQELLRAGGQGFLRTRTHDEA